MRIYDVRLSGFRCFEAVELSLDRSSEETAASNIHVILGENGSGKSSLLQGIALAVLGEAIQDSGLLLRAMVRREPGELDYLGGKQPGMVPQAKLSAHVSAPTAAGASVTHLLALAPMSNGRDRIVSTGMNTTEEAHQQLLSDGYDGSFLLMGYGPGRRPSPGGEFNFAVQDSKYAPRLQRVRSLFYDDHPLVPLSAWYPRMVSSHEREQVNEALESLLGSGFHLTEHLEDGVLVVLQDGVYLPIHALSDGYRSFLAWTSDLIWRLLQVATTTNRSLSEIPGVVLVDEVDLHLHPKWQRRIVSTLARTFPELQFILTTHSPLIVGSLRREHLHVLHREESGTHQLHSAVSSPYGLSTDQILTSDWFGLDDTRNSSFGERLVEVRAQAMSGDVDAFLRFTQMLSEGEEGDRPPADATGLELEMLPESSLARKD